MSDAWIALIAALAGGSVLKIIEYWLNRGRVAQEQSNAYREELRKDMESLRHDLQIAKEEAAAAQATVDDWRDKFYSLRDEFSVLKIKLAEAESHDSK